MRIQSSPRRSIMAMGAVLVLAIYPGNLVAQALPAAESKTPPAASANYRIGPNDLLDVAVLEASELNRSLRVSASGEISMPPLGTLKAAGLTPQELEAVIRELLRRSIMNDPHVTVFVREMESHPVSVTGAVKKPGVFHISGPKGLLEILSMAEGLADDAGTSAIVMRGANFPNRPPDVQGPAEDSVEVDLTALLNAHDAGSNVLIYPGDVVKVSRAGIVYVLGDVKKPGGFLLRNNERLSVLQALALAEGLVPGSAKNQTRIIRTDAKGDRTEIPVDLDKIMQGKSPDAALQPKDVMFIPRSGGRHAMLRSAELILSSVPGALVYRTW